MKLATIICYCTNDYRFIDRCILEAKKFSDQIIIPVCDHFFNGAPENRMLLEHTYANHPDCDFIEFAYSPTQLYNPYLNVTPDDEHWMAYWHATSRYVGCLHLKAEIDWVLFLDCDEIVEGERFTANVKRALHCNAVRLSCYYYVLRPDFRADKVQDLTLLVQKSALSNFFHPDERYALYRYAPEPKMQGMRGEDSRPLIHHYSWVRSKEECLRKAASWGHSRDRDWPKLIEEAFLKKKGKNLFGTELCFKPVEDVYFDPFSVEVPTKAIGVKNFSHVKRVDHRMIFKMGLEHDALL